jgi:hypothetical protein
VVAVFTNHILTSSPTDYYSPSRLLFSRIEFFHALLAACHHLIYKSMVKKQIFIGENPLDAEMPISTLLKWRKD